MKSILTILAAMFFITLIAFHWSCGPTPTPGGDSVGGDTSHIDVYFMETNQVVHIYCTDGDTINIPCTYEDDGVLTIICQDGIYVACGDTSH